MAHSLISGDILGWWSVIYLGTITGIDNHLLHYYVCCDHPEGKNCLDRLKNQQYDTLNSSLLRSTNEADMYWHNVE